MNMKLRIGGRQRGTPNKRSIQAKEKLEALGFDPLTELVAIARGEIKFETILNVPDGKGGFIQIVEDLPAPTDIRVRCTIELMGYSYPKRKAIEFPDIDKDLIPLYDLGSLTPRKLKVLRDTLKEAQEAARALPAPKPAAS